MDEISVPTHFTDHEGGGYRVWDSGPVADEAFDLRSPTRVLINGQAVHSLVWSPPRGQRWDCVNGWDRPFEKPAKKAIKKAAKSKPKKKKR